MTTKAVQSEQYKIVAAITVGTASAQCAFVDGTSENVPSLLGRYLRPRDRLTRLCPATVAQCSDFFVERVVNRQTRQWLFATISYVGQPKESDHGFYVRAALPSSNGPQSLILDSNSLRRYFYLLEDAGDGESLYRILHVPDSASPAELRMAWHLQSLEIASAPVNNLTRAKVDRAFNILSHPDLRKCYDRLCKDEDAPPLFPYGGFGSILVEGQFSADRQAFFGHRIVAYKPEMTSRNFSLLLRRCEFWADCIVCRDPRHRAEVWLDGSLFGGVDWDLTWNQWKHWLQSRIEVQTTLIHAGKYRLQHGNYILREWFVALPSRIHVVLPDDLRADIEKAQTTHALLGHHADLIAHVRAQIARQPVEHTVVQNWFDTLSVPKDLKPHHVSWQPDYEHYYFEQLRKRSLTWFLFRSEYLFVWPNVLISEIPEPGHATYLFARPDQLSEFTKTYSTVTRKDVRHNRGDIAGKLGFIGRVVRGRRKKRWLDDLLKQAGAKTDYVEAFE